MSATAIEGPHLHVVSGSRAGLNIGLTVGESGNPEWTIGSQPEREIVFPDRGVSPLHARIVNEGARWKVFDQMSANGTFVNGKRMSESDLSSGDRIRFGPVDCVFQTTSRAAAASRPSGGARVGSGRSASKGKTLTIGAIAFVVTIAVLFLVYTFVL
jgi:pSer/pThr/pTyr-binding forkhead associated (FHA) protein